MTDKRYIYKQISGTELTRRLNLLNMKLDTFARLVGWRADDVKRLVRANNTVPHWMHLILHFFERHHGNVIEARQLAAEQITHDLQRPQDGEYPFLEPENAN